MKSLNLYYIRAAIEANTGQRLDFPTIRRLLVEEKLITKKELNANPLAFEFSGYGSYFFSEDNSVSIPKNPRRFIGKGRQSTRLGMLGDTEDRKD